MATVTEAATRIATPSEIELGILPTPPPVAVSALSGERLDQTRPGQPEIIPENAVSVVETWNNPSINKARLPTAFLGFLLMGMSGGAPGAIIPYFREYYNLSLTAVSVLFLCSVFGYTLSAFTINHLYLHFGIRGATLLASLCQFLACISMALHPPYPVLIVTLSIGGLAGGINDASYSTFVGKLTNANIFMGILHGHYSIGAFIAPLVATAMVSRGKKWWEFYYVMTALSALAVLAVAFSFWSETRAKYRESHRDQDGVQKKGGAMREVLGYRSTWLVGFYMLFYIGAETAVGGWLVTFMINVRKGSAFDSGMVGSGFWLGVMLGSFTLGWVNGRFGVQRMTIIYLVFCMGFELLFWLVPQFYVSAIAAGLLGFTQGPMYPTGMMALTKLLPSHLHGSGIGFAAAFGAIGSAIFPFAVGAIAQGKGVQMMHPFVMAILAAQMGVWLCLPRMPGHEHEH